MKRKLLVSIIGGFIGLWIGVFGGGFVGLVLGGTFLGGLDIYKHTGFEGYELAAYIGALVAGIFDTVLGVKLALWMNGRTQSTL